MLISHVYPGYLWVPCITRDHLNSGRWLPTYYLTTHQLMIRRMFLILFCDIYYCHKIHCSCKKCHHLKMSVWWPDHGQCWTYSTWLEFNVMLLHWFITYNNTEHDEGWFDQDYAIKVYVKSFICLLKYLSLPWLSCNLPIRVIYEET